MRRENVKPSIVTYYQTRASILHPILAITQVNIGIYLLFAAPYINTRFQTVCNILCDPYKVAAPMFFRQLICLFLLFLVAAFANKLIRNLTLRDIKYCLLIGFIGISLSQYFQLQNFKTLLYQTGVHRLAIWQAIVPVMVTAISIALKLEKPSRARYVVIALDVTMVFITLILRFTVGKTNILLRQCSVGVWGK